MDEDGDATGIIDDEGRLFGYVNIIDALVVMLVLAVVVAGVALVLGSGGEDKDTPSQTTSYATVVFEPLPGDTAQPIQRNDTLVRADGTGEVTVTDVYRTFGPNGQTVTVGQLAVAPTAGEGTTFQTGNQYDFVTDGYTLNGTVRRVSNRSALRVNETSVRLSTGVSETTVDRLDTDETLTVGNETVGTIESITAYPTGTGSRYEMILNMTLRTIRFDGQPTFAVELVRSGTTLPLRFESVPLQATVETVGEISPPDATTNKTITVAWENVRPTRAAVLETGLAERHPGSDATIVDLSSEQATVVLETDAGELVFATHPENRDVTITLDARTRQVGQRPYFHGRSLQIGRNVTLDFGRVLVQGTVVDYE